MALVLNGLKTEGTLPLPSTIQRGLRRIDFRLKIASLTEGIGALLLVCAGVGAIVMAIDFIWPLPSLIRGVILVCWIVIGLGLGTFGVLRPVLRRHQPRVLAGLADRVAPKLGGSLTSAVEFVTEGTRAHGSPELIAAFVEQTGAEAEEVDFDQAVGLRRGWRWLAWGVVAAALVVGPPIGGLEPFATLGRRCMIPWIETGTAGLLAIDLQPGNALVGRGDTITIRATARNRLGGGIPASAVLEWSPTSDPSHRQERPMQTDPDLAGGFVIETAALQDSIFYRVRIGSGQTDDYQITVADPPSLSLTSVTIEPPEYLGEPVAEVKDPKIERLRVPQDSRLRLTIEADRPLENATLRWPTESERNKGSSETESVEFQPSDDRQEWSVTVMATASGPYGFGVVDDRGLLNQPDRSRSIGVIPDPPPKVVVENPEDRNQAVEPDDTLELPVAARDNLSVALAELYYRIGREGNADNSLQLFSSIDLEGLDTEEAHGIARLDLAQVNAQEGDRLVVQVRVLDNRPFPRGPNESWSMPVSVPVVGDIERFEADRSEESLGPAKNELDEIARLASANSREVAPLRYAAEATERGNGDWLGSNSEDLEELKAASREVVDRLQQLARSLGNDPTYESLEEPIREVAEADPSDAFQALQSATQANENEERLDELRRADTKLKNASRQIDSLKRRFDALAQAAAAQGELSELGRREEKLADQAEALNQPAGDPNDPTNPPAPSEGNEAGSEGSASDGSSSSLEQIEQDQERIAQELEEMGKQSPALQEAIGEAMEQAAQALQALQEAREADDPTMATQEAAEAMREAAQNLQNSSGSNDPASRANELAEQLAAEAAPSDTSPDPSPYSEPGGGMGSDLSTASVLPEALLADPRAQREWGELPGHLRSELLRASRLPYRQEYRESIRRYYRELAEASSNRRRSQRTGPNLDRP